MKRTLYILTVVLTLCVGMLSCLHDNDDETVLSEQCYISSFTLGQMKRTLHTLSTTGTDSTYTVAFSGSLYKLLIDQRAQTITNRDSLPVGTRLEAVLATITGTGEVSYAPVADTTTWNEFSNKDSIDFSEPLIFRMYSSSGKTWRDYTMTLIVRKSEPTSYTWSRMADIRQTSDANDEARLLMVDGQALALTFDAQKEKVIALKAFAPATTHDITGWTEQECIGLGMTPAVQSAQYFAGRYWMSGYHKLYVSDDAVAWQEVATEGITPMKLLAASATALYVSIEPASESDSPKIARSTDGQHWTTMDVEAGGFTGLPAAALAYRQSNGNRRVILLDNVVDGAAPLSAWNLLEESTEPWTLFAKSGDNNYLLPAQQHLNIVSYDGDLIALGGALVGGNATTALSKAYISHDNGITWKVDEDLVPPAAVQGTTGAVAAAAEGEYIWLVAGTQVWRTRKNSYGE